MLQIMMLLICVDYFANELIKLTHSTIEMHEHSLLSILQSFLLKSRTFNTHCIPKTVKSDTQKPINTV